MSKNKKKNEQNISRRAFLQGTGATLFLPFLESMWPSAAAAQMANVKRYAFIKFPVGVVDQSWNYNNVLAPLASLQSHITILKNCNSKLAFTANADLGHATATASILTQALVEAAGAGNTKLTYGIGTPQMSIDQAIADAVKQSGSLHSLTLRPPREGQEQPQRNSSSLYLGRISWRGNKPTPTLNEVKDVFNAIYGVSGSVSVAVTEKKRSIIDGVLASANALNNKLNAADKARFDAYLTNVREVEKRIPASGVVTQPVQCSTAGIKQDVAYFDMDQWFKAMLDLMVLAFQCDRTRVSTFQILVEAGRAFPAQIFSDIGLNGTAQGFGDVHNSSHYMTAPFSADVHNKFNRWYVERLRYMLDKMSKIPDGTGSLLDNSMIFYGANYGESHNHRVFDFPLLVAGKGGGTIQSGRTVDLNGYTLASVHLAAAKKMGLNISSFGRIDAYNGSGGSTQVAPF